MEIFPAIDIKDGQVVRLTQGDYDQVKVYASDPFRAARRFAEEGAKNLHIVDLDGARDGEIINYRQIHRIVSKLDLFVQIGGGIRDESRIRRYIDLGVGRVILGTVAVEQFEFLRDMVDTYGEKIAVSVDARGGRLAVRGWREQTEVDAVDFCKRLEQIGVRTVIYTDIARDGAMQGANLEIYRRLNEELRGVNIIASGGVGSLGEIGKLREMELYGAILGKALYEGSLTLREVLAAC